MNERMGLMARLAVAEGRLAAFAESPPPGLTDPDPATGERWDAGQAWAHVAEFVPYWQNELERVVAGARRGADPVRSGGPPRIPVEWEPSRPAATSRRPSRWRTSPAGWAGSGRILSA